MHRRTLLKSGLAAVAAGAVVGAAPAAATASRITEQRTARRGNFQLAYAPHFGMFQQHAGDDPVTQLEWAADQGFRAWEDNGMAGRPVAEQERIAQAMRRLGMKMGVFVANFGTAFGKKSFASNSPEMAENFLQDLRQAVEVAKRVDATWMTIVLGDHDPGMPEDHQHANAIAMLRRGAEIFAPHGLVMVMEPLNPWTDHPGMLLQRSSQAYMLCKAVASPSVKMLFDMYHQQVTEGNLIANIDRCWDEIAYFQIGDNPGRNEPGTGEVNYRNVFAHIHARGYQGVLGMEHGNSQPGRAGESAVVDAYRACDAF